MNAQHRTGLVWLGFGDDHLSQFAVFPRVFLRQMPRHRQIRYGKLYREQNGQYWRTQRGIVAFQSNIRRRQALVRLIRGYFGH